jgi:hypothetical protein
VSYIDLKTERKRDMKIKRHLLLLAFTLIGGMLGGMISQQVLVGGFVFAAKESSHEKVLRAESFELVDGAGEKRAHWTHQDGRTVLRIGDRRADDNTFILMQKPHGVALALASSGHNSIMVNCDEDGAYITFLDKSLRTARLTAQLDADGVPSLTIRDQEGTSRAVYGGSEGSGIVLFGEDGDAIWAAPLTRKTD